MSNAVKVQREMESIAQQRFDAYLRIEKLLDIHVQYKDGWTLRLQCDESRNNALYMQWVWWATCAKTSRKKIQHSRKWFVSEHASDSELVLTAFKAALTAEEHECRESFKFKGKRVLGPHIDVNALLTVCDIEDNRAEVTL